MKRLVVDASVIMAALKRDGRVRALLLGAPPHLAFYVPEFLFVEIEDNLDELAEDIGVPRVALDAVLRTLRPRLTVIPPEATDHVIQEAKHLTHKADAENDEEYVALALAMNAPIWSFDKDFDRIPGVKRIESKTVEASFESTPD
ncbi:MAG: PIN domain-containing protein [Thermoplasmatota archaeon]